MALSKLKRYNCPLCASDLGWHDPKYVFLVSCAVVDCKVKWCFKPDKEKPIAIDYPGMKKPKGCGCETCRARA